MKAMAVPLDAEDLAEFANLETDQDAQNFQRKTTGRDTGPDFAPAAWWNYHSTDSSGKPAPEKQWRFTQRLVREAWDEKFQSEVGLFALTRLLLSVFDPEGLTENLLSREPDSKLGDIIMKSITYQHQVFADLTEIAEEYGFHRAIRYFSGGPSWRLKKCAQCGRRFVADHNERKYCKVGEADGSKCSYKGERVRQKKWGQANNWGHPIKTRKSSPRLPGSQRKKPTAKT